MPCITHGCQMAIARFLESYVFGPSGYWTMAPLCYAAKLDSFLSLDCVPTPSNLVQSKERKGSNFAICPPPSTLAHSKKGRDQILPSGNFACRPPWPWPRTLCTSWRPWCWPTGRPRDSSHSSWTLRISEAHGSASGTRSVIQWCLLIMKHIIS